METKFNKGDRVKAKLYTKSNKLYEGTVLYIEYFQHSHYVLTYAVEFDCLKGITIACPHNALTKLDFEDKKIYLSEEEFNEITKI